MPSFTHRDATIYYEEFGQGFPILTFAPAGLQSTVEVWSRPATEWAAGFRVIAMDQRNAGGRSRAPITARDGPPTPPTTSRCSTTSASTGAISMGSASAGPSS
ncbi:MAG TPA: alpha/beta hydrolase [Methylomirabilota bacterium]|nr:alpha/beta hydrolase [Methylomirabilota bacterium]